MPLPQVKPQVNPVGNPIAPGQNPNQSPPVEKTPSPFSIFASNLGTTVQENISPMNFIRQGTYNAFGNNILTRGALGLADSLAGGLESMLNGPESERMTTDESIAAKQLQLLRENNELLRSVLTDKKESNFSEDLKKAMKESENPTIIEKIAVDVTEIKAILLDGFKNLGDIISKFGDIEEFKKTYPEAPSESRETGSTLYSMVDRIVKNTDKVVSILSDKPISTMEEDAERLRREKNMGMAIEVPTDKALEMKKPPEEGGSWFDGIWIAVLAFADDIIKGIKNIGTKFFDKSKEMVGKIGDFLSEKWKVFKEGAAAVFDRLKAFADDAIEKGKTLLGKAKDFALSVPEKFKGVKDKIVSKVSQSVAKQAGKSAVKLGATAVPVVGPVLGALTTLGFAGYDAYDSASNAEDVLDIKGREATGKETFAAGAGGVAESLSFGLIDRKDSAKWINDLMTTDKSRAEHLEKTKDELNDMNDRKNMSPGDPSSNTNLAINNTNNSYFSSRRSVHNEDQSFNRYMDSGLNFG